MSSAGERKHFPRTSPAPDSAPSQPCEDEQPEASDGGSEGSVKKEETRELSISNQEHNLTNTTEVIAIKVEEADNQDCLYCEVCKSFFFKKCEVHGPPLFIPDTPVPMGVVDRARQTLPPGLEIQESSILHAGLGVFNKRETVPVGAHFGPYQGELVDREEAMNSGFSWVLSMSRQCEKYIDAKREMHSNWMRFVNCASDDGQQNLVAFQYQGGILYRCCRPINPGQELLVWYEEEYAKALGPTFDDLWSKKCSANEKNNTLLQIFSCSLCPLRFTSQMYFGVHIRRCHAKEYRRLQNSEEIKYEVQIPAEDSSHQQASSDDTLSFKTSHKEIQKEIHHCSQCGKNFTHQRKLQQHQRIHTTEKPYHCSQCGKRFTRPRKLQQHQRIHARKKPYHCSQCGKSFSQRSHLQRHRRIHTGEKPHHCSQCGKRFNCKGSLQIHQRIHTGEKPYHCSQCGKRFICKGNLQTHQHIHMQEKPFQCSQCGKSFSQQSHFQKHQHIHTGEKPYHCAQCGKRFSQQTHLQRHHYVHTGEKPYHCAQCGKSFTCKSSLQLHQRIHTGEKPYHCSQCGKSFICKGSLQEHHRVHTGEKPYHCLQCGKSFTKQGGLRLHQRLHTGEKPYHCSQCGKSFTRRHGLQLHQRIHTGEKPYHCSQCGKNFNQQSNLRKHQYIHTRKQPAYAITANRN